MDQSCCNVKGVAAIACTRQSLTNMPEWSSWDDHMYNLMETDDPCNAINKQKMNLTIYLLSLMSLCDMKIYACKKDVVYFLYCIKVKMSWMFISCS